ncbi:MAG: type VI secretion system tip protein VgrG [Chitinivibrionales bacterium]|nr:type VI secretion system tip protein VgrG [Chitinivibrionales bacterium]
MNTPAKANEARFLFLSEHMDAETFAVGQLRGADGLSSLYDFDLQLLSVDATIDSQTIIHQKATLFFNREGMYCPYSGIITTFDYCGTATDYSFYRVTLQPLLWKLTLSKRNRIFQNLSVPAVIEQVLKESNLAGYCQQHLSAAYPQREYIVQYEETDFHFINRLMEDCGIWYFFKQEPVTADNLLSKIEEKMVMTDMVSCFESVAAPSTMKFKSRSGFISADASGLEKEYLFDVSLHQRLVPRTVAVKSYNYRTPEINLSSMTTVPEGDFGLFYEYGGSFKDVTQAENQARISANRFSSQQTIIQAKSVCPGFRAGSFLTMEEHLREQLNGKQLITRVEHFGSTPLSSGRSDAAGYHNKYQALPWSKVQYYRPAITASKPRMPGVFNARIEGQKSEYATLDDQGRYKVRMPFDLSDVAVHEASKYIRMTQLYSGNGYGMHLPSHENAEMVIGHVNADPDKPIGLGTLANTNTKTPVTSDNRRESVIRTAGDNLISMDDTKGKQVMHLSAPYDQSFSSGNNTDISVGGNRRITVMKNESLRVAADDRLAVQKSETITIGKDKQETITGARSNTVRGNSNQTFSADTLRQVIGQSQETIVGTCTITVKKDESLTCGVCSSIKTGGDDTLKVSGSASMETAVSCIIKAQNDIAVEGKTIAIEGVATLTAQVGASSVVITPASVAITAPSITLAALELKTAAKAVAMVTGGIVKIN